MPEPGIAGKAPQRKDSLGGEVVGWFIEGLLEALFATEIGLVVFGVLAVGVGLPLLLLFGGAALAARSRRRSAAQDTPDKKALLTAVLAPGVLVLVLLVLAGAGGLSWESFRHGHPAGVIASCAAAAVAIAGLGWAAMRRRQNGP